MHILTELKLPNWRLASIFSACKELNFQHSFIHYDFDTRTLVGLPEEPTKMFALSTTGPLSAYLDILDGKEVHLANEYGDILESQEVKSSFLDAFSYHRENFHQNIAIKAGIPMVNSDAQVLSMSDNLTTKFDSDVFIKPSDDMKGFVATILKAGETIEEGVKKVKRLTTWKDIDLIVSKVKYIDREYRFFVWNGEVVTGSQYFENGVVSVSEHIPQHIQDFAKKITSKFHPAKGFTIDIAEMKNKELKVVEYNCINISGHYASNMTLLLSKIKRH